MTFWTHTDVFWLENGSHESYIYRKFRRENRKFSTDCPFFYPCLPQIVRFAEKSVKKSGQSVENCCIKPVISFRRHLRHWFAREKIWFICWIVHEKVLVHLFKSSQWKIFVHLFKSSRTVNEQLFVCSKVHELLVKNCSFVQKFSTKNEQLFTCSFVH